MEKMMEKIFLNLLPPQEKTPTQKWHDQMEIYILLPPIIEKPFWQASKEKMSLPVLL
jgi:hypothetical protein